MNRSVPRFTARPGFSFWLTGFALAAAFAPIASAADAPDRPPISVQIGQDNKLVYRADPQGNRVIDFSYAGYAGGGVAIPTVPARITVEPDGRNDRARIQAALDLVAALPVDANGFRGAVLLKPGRYTIDTSLRLGVSGVVLRGSGDGTNGTVLVAAGQGRRALLDVGGRGERTEIASSRKTVADAFVPVGAMKLTLADVAGLAVGDAIVVNRPSTAEWIALLGMDQFNGWNAATRIHWRPGTRDLAWDRTITAIDGNTITLDAPLTTSLDAKYGGGNVAKYDFPGRIDHVGVENLHCISSFDASHPKDEEHSWFCVALDKVQNAWVRQLTAEHFVSYVVNAEADTKSLTIEDCTALDPISEIAAMRRRVFSIGGQMILVQRCLSYNGFRDFTTGFTAPGPNVFLQCTARDAMDYSGPVESWASGILYDNVIIRGNALRLMNRGLEEQGAGWAAANSLLWNCRATDIQVQSPPGASNQGYGNRGDVTDDNLKYNPSLMPYRTFDKGESLKPDSLYLTQLAERKGSASFATPAVRQAISLDASGARALTKAEGEAYVQKEIAAKKALVVHPLKVENAKFTIDDQPAWTTSTNWSWYLGQMSRKLARRDGPAITRFAPGEIGVGQTDDLEEMVKNLPPRSTFNQHYGLWYDRQRVNHFFYGAPEHREANAWGPFMEQPWARSGLSRDWDGLSKYDLTKFNPWFFSRLKEFADLADTHGVILYENIYFQHPIQETRAHYSDFPWRPENCLQDTGLPDENPAGATFYDLTSPVRRDLHRLYIRHCLDVLKDNVNVVYGIDREFSGPLSFVQFWLDTIADWEKENNRKVRICLEVPKAEMDAILEDPVRGPMITAIDFFNFAYRADGTLFTIVGGINRAPREQIMDAQTALSGGPGVGAIGALLGGPGGGGRGGRGGGAGGPPPPPNYGPYRALREYRDAYPQLVILPKNTDGFPTVTAAVEKNIPRDVRAQTRAALLTNHRESSWAMAKPGKTYVVYTMKGETIDLDLSKDNGTFGLSWVDTASGELKPAAEPVVAGKVATLAPPTADGKPWVAWLTRR